jgi:hypothetical protein
MSYFKAHRTTGLALKAIGFLLLALAGVSWSLWSQDADIPADRDSRNVEVQSVPSLVPFKVTSLPYGDCDSCVGTAIEAGAPLGPQSIKCDEQGLIYLLDSLNRRLLVYTSMGKSLTPVPLPAPGDDFCVLSDGTIWEMDLTQRSFFHLCPDGTIIKQV